MQITFLGSTVKVTRNFIHKVITGEYSTTQTPVNRAIHYISENMFYPSDTPVSEKVRSLEDNIEGYLLSYAKEIARDNGLSIQTDKGFLSTIKIKTKSDNDFEIRFDNSYQLYSNNEKVCDLNDKQMSLLIFR